MADVVSLKPAEQVVFDERVERELAAETPVRSWLAVLAAVEQDAMVRLAQEPVRQESFG